MFVRGVAHEHLLARVGPMGLHGKNAGAPPAERNKNDKRRICIDDPFVGGK